MKKKMRTLLIVFGLLFLSAPPYLHAQSVHTSVAQKDGVRIFSLSNDKVIQEVYVKDSTLAGDLLKGKTAWLTNFQHASQGVATDGDFSLKMMWNDWSAPGRQVNANVAIAFSKKDFRFRSYEYADAAGGGKELSLFFVPANKENRIMLRVRYQLLPGKFYSRRQISVLDSSNSGNWLDEFVSRNGRLTDAGNRGGADVVAMLRRGNPGDGDGSVVKKGSFGQPCALDFPDGGVFFGIEYPAATTTVKEANGRLTLACQEMIGAVVKKDWISSKWVVEGLAPDHHVQEWFYTYVDDIKYTPDRPYALYNSWYDLRSPAFTRVESSHIMNEKNIMQIISDFKKNMIEPYDIHLDAFVLDDGWDVHHSDWQLRKATFPNGLRPISNALKPLGTTLGIWYGPTGGYSFRQDRIDWMKGHGYEVTANDMMCIGGKNYSALFKERNTDMVQKGGVGYFKWDGIQFSCSAPSHGHPTGYYSRRALQDSIFSDAEAVRKVDPNVYLNITSGTWLSPWWLSHANQIWMQGEDFGFAGVPSVNQRDASMTYKDIVLYNDFHNQDNWFPVSNLMTHGIIKGRLNEIGGTDDPLNKFTDDVMFYFGRGVTMYELYISPDLLNKGEWNALSKSLKWAEDRFPVLDHTYMTGGDPTKIEAYGYLHFVGSRGIIAVRNPGIRNQAIEIKLDPAKGLNPKASSLVLERVYPTRWISPDLYAAGATVNIPLDGYETAVYEVYPLDSARKPLIGGVSFNVASENKNHLDMDILQVGKKVKVLNPDFGFSLHVNGRPESLNKISIPDKADTLALESKKLSLNGSVLTAEVNLSPDVVSPRFVVFLHPDSTYQGKPFPDGELLVDSKRVKPTKQEQNGVWSVYSHMLPEEKNAGKHQFKFELKANANTGSWMGKADVWLITQKELPVQKISITSTKDMVRLPEPPSPFQKNAVKLVVELGAGNLHL